MYDSLLFTYPNRTDLWSVYIDMLVKYERKIDARYLLTVYTLLLREVYFKYFFYIRDVFNRIIQLNLNAKRMKFIFKKYIDFEKLYGDDQLVNNVKEMALKYVENKEQVFKMALPKQQNDDVEMAIENDLEKTLIKKLK